MTWRGRQLQDSSRLKTLTCFGAHPHPTKTSMQDQTTVLDSSTYRGALNDLGVRFAQIKAGVTQKMEGQGQEGIWI